MTTWLKDFQERTDLNKYPVALRTRGGIGYKVGRDVVSNFVGHPVHYLDGKEWKPITLAHDHGQFEGNDFGWNGYAVTYKKKVLFTPESITFNGVVRLLNFFLDADNHRLVADVPGVGEYEILFTERGVKEILTIPEPVEGLLTFQVRHEKKPAKIYKQERKLAAFTLDLSAAALTGDEYLLTKEMKYPLVIDPDYAGTTADGYVYGLNATYSIARATSTGYNSTNTGGGNNLGQLLGYYVIRLFLKFDTSGIPDEDVISQVNFKGVLGNDSSSTNFDVVIKKHNWSAQDPLSDINRESAYDDCLAASADDDIWINTSGKTIYIQYASGNLAIEWPSKTDYTYYSLQSSRDISGTIPTQSESVGICTQDNSTAAYRPILTIVHAAAAKPYYAYAQQ